MAFYIRKAFKTGPIRLNLSKGGVGLSGGITGARVGINSRGTYVHGGRHGVYYRKYMTQERNINFSTRKNVKYSDPSHHPTKTNFLFRDTGVTYCSKSAKLRNLSRKEPALPSSKLLTLPNKFIIGFTLFLLFFSLINFKTWLAIVASIVVLLCLGWIGLNYFWLKRADNALKEITKRTNDNNELKLKGFLIDIYLPNRWRIWLNSHLHLIIGELAIRHEELDTLSTFQILDEEVPLDIEIAEIYRASILGNLIDEMLEDHHLSEEEELEFRHLLDQLKIPKSLIINELERLDYYSQIRKIIERPFEKIDPGIPLVRGEDAYDVIPQARLLNEQIIRRFQHNNIQYRELGFKIESEGKLIITNRRLLLIGSGTSQYRLNRLIDITADPDTAIVELIFSNRKSPVLITVKEPLFLAARLEKIINKK